jgi:outer membrane lipoprotein-sorting protein
MNIAPPPTMSTTFRRLLILPALLAALSAPALALAAGWDVDQLMASLAKTRFGRATFVEKKYIAMLDEPVLSSGELSYAAPDHLEKRTLKPKPESMVIDGDVLLIERGRRKMTVQLQEYPELAGFIDSVRGTLAGDRKTLEKLFRLQLEGEAEQWTLLLSPTLPKMAGTIRQIRIGGSRDDVRSIEILQADGDRSVTTITRVAS